MSTQSKNFPVFLYFILCASAVMQFSCGKKIESRLKGLAGDAFPDQIVKNFTMDKYEVEDHRWDFFADRADVFEKKKKVHSRNVKMQFYKASKVSSVISANKAVLSTETGDIEVKGNVIIFSLLENTTIFTDSLNYFEKSKRVSSDSFVRQEKSDITITGSGLEANTDLSDITILRDVKAVKK